MNNVGVLANHNEEFAARHLSKAKWFLTQNIDDFPTYKTWQKALAAAVEEEETNLLTNENSRYKCSCRGLCNCNLSATTKKKVIRL